jgi:hypothetical protein
MLSFTDEQLETITRAASPLAPWLRAPFLEAVARALRNHPIGDGSVARACAELQREFLRLPQTGNGRGRMVGKYSR